MRPTTGAGHDELLHDHRDREVRKSADGRGGALSKCENLESGTSHQPDTFRPPESVLCVASRRLEAGR